jgi:hypothetical protein
MCRSNELKRTRSSQEGFGPLDSDGNSVSPNVGRMLCICRFTRLALVGWKVRNFSVAINSSLMVDQLWRIVVVTHWIAIVSVRHYDKKLPNNEALREGCEAASDLIRIGCGSLWLPGTSSRTESRFIQWNNSKPWKLPLMLATSFTVLFFAPILQLCNSDESWDERL